MFKLAFRSTKNECEWEEACTAGKSPLCEDHSNSFITKKYDPHPQQSDEEEEADSPKHQQV